MIYRMKSPCDQYENPKYVVSIYTQKEVIDIGCETLTVREGQIFLHGRGKETVGVFSITIPYVLVPHDTYRRQSPEDMAEEYLEQQQAMQMMQKRAQSILGPKKPQGDDPREMF